MTDTADDRACVVRCLRGDPTAFEPIVRRYERVLFTVALRMLGSYEDAQDVVQNAFIRAYQRLETFDPQRKFFSWLYRIAVNESLNAIRARRPVEDLDQSVAVEAGLDEVVEAAQLRDRVQLALMALTKDQREVVVLRHFADSWYDEIAETLDIPAITVKSRLFTARQRLAEILGDKEEVVP